MGLGLGSMSTVAAGVVAAMHCCSARGSIEMATWLGIRLGLGLGLRLWSGLGLGIGLRLG